MLAGCDVVTYDILFDDPNRRAPRCARRPSVRACARQTRSRTRQPDADLIISAVTAIVLGRRRGACRQDTARRPDCSSTSTPCSPAKKQSSSRDAVEARGADYVESAVMAPVPPQRLKVPMLLGGRRAAELAPRCSRASA